MKPNSDLWIHEKARFMVGQMAKAEDTAAIMNQGYYLAQKRLEKEADKIFARFQSAYGLTEDEAREILSRSGLDIDAAVRALVASEKGGRNILAELNGPAYAHRIQALRESSVEIDRLMEQLIKRDRKLLTNHLKRSAKDAYLHSVYLTQQQAGVSFKFKDYDPEHVDKLLRVKWSKKHFKDAIGDNIHGLGDAIKEEFLVNYLTGRSTEAAADSIAQRFNFSYYQARRLVRTESTYIEAEMEAQGYEACHIDKYEYVSILDNRTSELCQQHDGKIYKVSERMPGVNFPPLHVWCRSTTIAHIPDDYLEQAPAGAVARSGQRVSFNDWKKEF